MRPRRVLSVAVVSTIAATATLSTLATRAPDETRAASGSSALDVAPLSSADAKVATGRDVDGRSASDPLLDALGP